jgi:predicted aspartyl protease
MTREGRMRKTNISLLVTALAVTSTLARGTDKPAEIPFKLTQGFAIVMRGDIGRLSNLNILLDTGAVPSVVSKRVAGQIGAKGVAGSFALLQKDTEAQYVTVDEVNVGWVRATRLPMVIVDLSWFEQLLGTRIDAILGLDAFAGQSFSIDYKRGKITQGLSGTTRHAVPVEIHTAAGAPYWVVQIHIGGQGLRVLIDTGADQLGVFGNHAAGLLDTRKAEVKLRSATKGRVLEPTLLLMGDMSVKKQTVTVLGQPPRELGEVDGVLGPTALRITRMEFDWEHQCLRWDVE